MKKAFLFLSLVLITVFSASAQDVADRSYTTSLGEKVLRFEVTLPVGKKRAWRAFTDPEDMKGWIAPVIKLDMRAGGTLLTNYDKAAKIEDASTIRLPIINYLEGELITYKVQLNNAFPKKSAGRGPEPAGSHPVLRSRERQNKARLIDDRLGHRKGMGRCLRFFLRRVINGRMRN